MECENVFCIYQKNGLCSNENEIYIDWRGFCKNMIPVRITNNMIIGEKMITQLYKKDGKHYFDKETGVVTLTDEAITYFDSEFELD